MELAFGHGDLTVNEEDGVAMVCVVLAVAQEPLGIAVSFTLETEMLNATGKNCIAGYSSVLLPSSLLPPSLPQ